MIGCVYAFADVARRQGKRIEPALLKKQGGLPSTTMLRHRDGEFTAEEKKPFADNVVGVRRFRREMGK